MKQLSFLLILLSSIKLFGQAVNKPNPLNNYRYSIGFLGNHTTIEIQAEYKLFENLGIRIAGTRIFGYSRSKEFGIEQ